MWLSDLGMDNWLCFRGKHAIKLHPRMYSLVAHRAGNGESSNWAGKSAVLEAIYFCLTGRLNPDRHMGADGWITDGESKGGTQLTFSNGLEIVRERKKSTKLRATFEGRLHEDDEAQRLIDEMVGLTADDLLATSYFQQRKMARLVLAEPSVRMGYVSEWMQLAPLEHAEENLRVAINLLVEEASKLASRMSELDAITLGDFDLAAAEKALTDARAKHTRLGDLAEKNARLHDAQRLVQSFDALCLEIKEARAELKEYDADALEKSFRHASKMTHAAVENLTVAQRDFTQKLALAAGQFDGNCPVANMACPATVQINTERTRARGLRDAAQKLYDEARYAHADATRAESQALAAWQSYQRKFERVKEMEARHDRTLVEYTRAKDSPEPMNDSELRTRADEAHRKVVELTAQIADHNRAHQRREAANREYEATSLRHAELEKKIATHREALVIFGKQGAQRRIAEHALGVIEENANALLSDCGIPLEVDVSWSREGSGHAKACDTCGMPFPATAKVKACQRCGAARGPHLVNKLNIILSDQSGAAEDLAGAAIQLAASAWLRSARSSKWSLAMIDEPAGALDSANRKLFATHLRHILGSRFGFEQAIVVAHHSEISDALPGRIVITNDGKFSKIEVAA